MHDAAADAFRTTARRERSKYPVSPEIARRSELPIQLPWIRAMTQERNHNLLSPLMGWLMQRRTPIIVTQIDVDVSTGGEQRHHHLGILTKLQQWISILVARGEGSAMGQQQTHALVLVAVYRAGQHYLHVPAAAE